MNPKDSQIMDDQIILASQADKCFGDIRKKAKENPQFILDNDKIDSVVLSIEQYENLLLELEKLREAFLFEIFKSISLSIFAKGVSFSFTRS